MYHYRLTKIHKGYVYIQAVSLIYSFLCVSICVSGGSLIALEGKGKPAGSVLSLCHMGSSLGSKPLDSPPQAILLAQ